MTTGILTILFIGILLGWISAAIFYRHQLAELDSVKLQLKQQTVATKYAERIADTRLELLNAQEQTIKHLSQSSWPINRDPS